MDLGKRLIERYDFMTHFDPGLIETEDQNIGSRSGFVLCEAEETASRIGGIYKVWNME